jgi:hypothetical protein
MPDGLLATSCLRLRIAQQSARPRRESSRRWQSVCRLGGGRLRTIRWIAERVEMSCCWRCGCGAAAGGLLQSNPPQGHNPTCSKGGAGEVGGGLDTLAN